MSSRLVAAVSFGALALAVAAAVVWWRQRLPSPPRFLSMELPELRIWARNDQVKAGPAEELLIAADQVEIWLESPGELGPVVFRVDGRPGRLQVGSRDSRQEYQPPVNDDDARIFFEWSPETARHAEDRPGSWYRLDVSFPDRSPAPETDLRLAFVGTRALLDRDLYHVDWLGCGAPKTVSAGKPFLVLAHARNTSEHPWPDRSHAGVRLAWRWPGGDPVARIPLGAEISPEDELERWLEVTAPDAPGRYQLDVDLYFEPVAWFSERGAATCRVDVEVR